LNVPLLEVKDLCVWYGPVQALRGISLRVERGEVVALLGANGAGKSTTLRTISGLLKPREGAVAFDGKPIAGSPPHRIVCNGLVHVPEGRGIFSQLTVEENLQLGAFTRHDRAQLAKDRERAIARFPRIGERMQQPAGTLSGGEQQMLAVARALLARPKLLLLDEPSLGLAPQVVRTIFEILREINRDGTTILIVEQNARMALELAHRAYVLEVGRIRREGTAAELAASDEIQKAYLGESAPHAAGG
jgi:branched-chain amino acid transport system ATP-binding protein